MDPMVVSSVIRKFVKTLEIQLLEEGQIPCAFAVMTVDSDWQRFAQFNILSGVSPRLLPKGKDEVEEFLCKALRRWEDKNYPDKVIISDIIGRA